MIIRLSAQQQDTLLTWARRIGAAERADGAIPSGYEMVLSMAPGLGWDAKACSGRETLELGDVEVELSASCD